MPRRDRVWTLILVIMMIALMGVIAADSHGAEPFPPGANGMALTFSETFDKPLSWCSEICIGNQRWRTKYYHSGETPLSRGLGMTGTESEVYMDPRYLGLGVNPFHIDKGGLTIETLPATDRVKTAVVNAWPSWWTGERLAPKFTSGALTTEKSFRQLYGYFEASMKLSNVIGAWPAFWLYEGNGDEIDIMEVLAGRPTRHYASVHRVVGDDRKQIGQEVVHDTVDLSEDFHIYGVRWTPDEIVFYFDNVEIGRLPNIGLHLPMYILLNMAMDGDWNKKLGFVAEPDARTMMQVRFVKAYAMKDVKH